MSLNMLTDNSDRQQDLVYVGSWATSATASKTRSMPQSYYSLQRWIEESPKNQAWNTVTYHDRARSNEDKIAGDIDGKPEVYSPLQRWAGEENKEQPWNTLSMLR